jgi:hypothetical protein
MAKAIIMKQISFETRNKVGQLESVTSVLKDARINIKALCAYGMGKKAYFMLVTNNNTKAKRALKKLKVKTREEGVVGIEMQNRIGQLKNIASKVADAGIDIQYVYGTTGVGKSSLCILKTVNDTRALKALK